MMYDIVKILMDRDGISRSDAQAQVDECKARLAEEAIPTGDYELAVDIIADELGLEPDYMMDLLI